MPLQIYNNSQTRSRSIIAVASGKGGVGKSTVALNLARALHEKGAKVGIIDADIYGPSLSRMIPFEKNSSYNEEGVIVPARAEGMSIVSVGYLTAPREAIVLRAPLANRMVEQFLQKTLWGDVEVIVIDFPPGTGDIQITLAQKAALVGAILVTTPQALSQDHVDRAAKMFSSVKVPLLGVVENMSFYQDQEGGEKRYLFGEGGGRRLSQILQTPLLAQIPLSPSLSRFGDLGFSPFRSESPELRPIQKIFLEIAGALSLKTTFELQSFSLLDKKRVKLLWSDGREERVEIETLLALCPCAKCKEGRKREPKESPTTSFKEAEILGIKAVGRYAVQFQMDKGCSEGIFSYELLRNRQ